MSATLQSLRTWNDRQYTTVNTIHQRPTAGSAVGLREVAAQQAQVLRAAFGGPKPPTGRAAAARQRVIDHKARTAAATSTPEAPKATTRVSFAEIDARLAGIPVGFYGLPKREDATNGRQPFYFFKVHAFRGGKRIIMVTGGVGAWTERTMKALWQLRAVEGILRDVAGAARVFGDQTSHCGFCAAKGRLSPLTDHRSVAAGYGRRCAETHGLPW